jgi:hypothetical protein
MEVEFVLRPEDPMVFFDYVRDHPTQLPDGAVRVNGWLVVVILAVPATFSVFFLTQGVANPLTLGPPVACLIALMLNLLWRPWFRWRFKRNLEKNPAHNVNLHMRRRMSLAPEGLVVTTEAGTSTTPWAAVEAVVVSGNVFV